MRRPIVSVGTSLRTCVKVREAIELPFGVVSWVGREVGELDGVHVPRATTEREV